MKNFVGFHYRSTQPTCCQVSTRLSNLLGSFNSPVGGISESRHLTLRVTSRLRLFKENG